MESLIKVEDLVKKVASLEAKNNYTLNCKFRFIITDIRIRGSLISFKGRFPQQDHLTQYYLKPNFSSNFDGYGNSKSSYICYRDDLSKASVEADNVFQAIDQLIACQYNYQVANNFSQINMHYRYMQNDGDANTLSHSNKSLVSLEQQDRKLGASAELPAEISEIIKEQKKDAQSWNAFKSYNKYDK